jgi:hypothetical protein
LRVPTALLGWLLAAPPPEEVSRALDEVWESTSYQRELPSDEPIRHEAPARRESRRAEPRGEGSTGVGTALFWVLVGSAAVVVLLWAVRAVSGYERDAAAPTRGGESARGPPPDLAAVARPLEEAEALAREGRYGEAIHALLLRLLSELARRTPEPIPDSLTSREIVRRVALAPDARDPLARLVHAVEVTRFGGEDAGRDDYDLCLDRYRAFARAYAGEAA